jgi:hypothetical protein
MLRVALWSTMMACTPQRQEVHVDPVPLPSTATTSARESDWRAPLPCVDEPGDGRTPTTNDLSYDAPTDHQIRTPLAIYFEYTGSETIQRVELHYKSCRMRNFKTIYFERMAGGYGAMIPCADIVDVSHLRYFIHIFNDSSENVGGGGSRNNPYVVPIVERTSGPPPHLPGKRAPRQCPP